MRAIVAGLTVLLSFLGTKTAFACDCDAPPLADALARADAIFEGRVQTVSAEGANFRITQHWKGVGDVEELEVDTSTGSCGLSFVEGEVYLVYASLEGTRLRTSVCDRTATFDEAESDLQALGPGVVPVDPGEDPEPEPEAPAAAERCSMNVGGGGGMSAAILFGALALLRRRRRCP